MLWLLNWDFTQIYNDFWMNLILWMATKNSKAKVWMINFKVWTAAMANSGFGEGKLSRLQQRSSLMVTVKSYGFWVWRDKGDSIL